jgi:hypothetical protein
MDYLMIDRSARPPSFFSSRAKVRRALVVHWLTRLSRDAATLGVAFE